MKKKTLLLTTLAGTMLVAGMTGTSVKAAVEAKTTISEDTNSALVELVSSTDVLTKADLKALVEARYEAKGVKVTATVEGETVGTGTKVSLSNGKTLTLVVYGDLDGDGEVGPYDLDTLSQVLVGKAELNDATKVAGDIADNEEIDPMDLDIMSQFLVGKSAVVEAEKVLPETINATLGIGVEKEEKTKASSGLWAILPNAETNTTEVTLKVEKGTGTVSFDLSNVPTGATVGEKSEGVKVTVKKDSTATTTVTTATVAVPKKVGIYTFTMKTETGYQTITVKVEDVTLPTTVTFEEIQEEDVTKVTTDSEIIENMTEVYRKHEELAEGKEDTTFGTDNITFYGNVNKMNESGHNGKYYARVKVAEYDNTNLVAAYVEDGKVVKLETVPVEGTANTVYVLLDSNRATTNLVMAPVEATDAQIKTATSTNEVKFESTSKLQRFNARTANSGTGALSTQKPYVVSAEKDEEISNKIAVGVNLSGLKEVLLDTSNFTIVEESSATTRAGKWVPIVVQLLEKSSNQNLATTLTVDSKDVILQTVKSPTEVYLWVNADKEETKTCTVVYNGANGYKEELTLSIDIHNAADPVIEKAVLGEGIKGVVVTPEPTPGNKEYTISTATWKYAMTEGKPTADQIKQGAKDVKGRWYSIIFETDVPVRNLQYKVGRDKNDIPEENIISDNKAIIWINRDDPAVHSNRLKLINKYNENAKEIIVKVNQVENTYVEMHNTTKVGGFFLNQLTQNQYSDRQLQGVIVEDINKDLSLEHNLAEMKKLKESDGSIHYDSTKDVTTIKLPISNIALTKVNNVPGQWVVMYMTVKSLNITDKNDDWKNGVYIDTANKSILVSQDDPSCSGFYCVPVWINLSNETVKKAITTTNARVAVEPLEIAFGHATPVGEETNSFKVIFEDSSSTTKVDTAHTSDPEVAEIPSNFEQGNQPENHKEYGKWLDEDNNKETTVTQEQVTALQHNADLIDSNDIEVEKFDNIVHVTIKANFNNLQAVKLNDTTSYKLIPIELDISAIASDDEGNEVYALLAGQSSWVKSEKGTDYDDDTFYLSAVYNGTNTVKDLIFTRANNFPTATRDNLNTLTTPYIHYIIEFVQE